MSGCLILTHFDQVLLSIFRLFEEPLIFSIRSIEFRLLEPLIQLLHFLSFLGFFLLFLFRSEYLLLLLCRRWPLNADLGEPIDRVLVLEGGRGTQASKFDALDDSEEAGRQGKDCEVTRSHLFSLDFNKL